MKDRETHEKLAQILFDASENVQQCEPFYELCPGLTLEDGREIQMINIKRRLEQGHKMVGKKVGATNKVMRDYLGLKEPVMGYLLSDIIRDQNEEIPRSSQIKPFIEAEVCFVLEKKLEGPNVHPYDVLQACKGVMPAIELPDLRIKGDQDMVAALSDNVYNGLLVVGDTMADVRGIDFSDVPITIYKNGEIAAEVNSRNVMGNPLYVVAWLANKLYEYGECLEAGDIVITGSTNPAIYIDAGDEFLVDFGPIGKVKTKYI